MDIEGVTEVSAGALAAPTVVGAKPLGDNFWVKASNLAPNASPVQELQELQEKVDNE